MLQLVSMVGSCFASKPSIVSPLHFRRKYEECYSRQGKLKRNILRVGCSRSSEHQRKGYNPQEPKRYVMNVMYVVFQVVIERLCILNIQSNRNNQSLGIKLSGVASVSVKTSFDEIVLYIIKLIYLCK